jgi:glycosyltransferase involved in cell wall biosynthesis
VPCYAEAMPSPSPFWSVMIPVYNSTEFLAKTLESVLCQDLGPDHMQIEVVDGHSTRNEPSALVRRVAGDRVAVFRHAEPLPMFANWNSCIQRARGEWVHILHSDDLVLPGFYSRLRESLAPRPELGAAFVRWSIIDENGDVLETAAKERPEAGVLEEALERLSTHCRIQFPAMVVRKSAYAAVGGFSSEFIFALDWEMWSRIAGRYPIWYEPAVLACHRAHAGSETSRLSRAHLDCQDHGKCMAVIARRLPAHSAIRDQLAASSIQLARDLFVYRQVGAAYRQLRITLGIRSSPAVMRSMVSMLGWSAIQACRASLRKFGLAPPRPVA